MKIGIIGGSGIYEMEGLTGFHRREIRTPFGRPSDVYAGGNIGGQEVFFLPRHGRGHRILPSEINYRANIFGFKMLGVERVISISAVGSLKEELCPGTIVLPDQYYDRTKNSIQHSFFGEGIVAHVGFSEPACAELRKMVLCSARKVLGKSARKNRSKVYEGGTYVNIEGPAFSTRTESLVYRKHGFDVIGMTGLAEAKLCREAEMCFQGLSMVTDYDCWRKSREPVTVEMVTASLVSNTALAKAIILDLIPMLGKSGRTCRCGQSLESAIATSRRAMPAKTKKTLKPIIGKYL